jgi:hypothetical protein
MLIWPIPYCIAALRTPTFMSANVVKGGVKLGQCGGAKVGQLMGEKVLRYSGAKGLWSVAEEALRS